MSEELKPCPFCGKLVANIYHSFRDDEDISHDVRIIDCPNCRTLMQDPNSPANPNVIIHKWNSRPIEDALRADLEAARARIAKLEAANRWIPVGERLPENGNTVLAISNTSTGLAYWDMDLHKWFWTEGETAYTVTHWLFLPKFQEDMK